MPWRIRSVTDRQQALERGTGEQAPACRAVAEALGLITVIKGLVSREKICCLSNISRSCDFLCWPPVHPYVFHL